MDRALKVVSGELESQAEVVDGTPNKNRASIMKRAGLFIGKTAAVCALATPCAIFTGYKIIDYMNDTSVKSLRDGLEQQTGAVHEVKGSIDNGVTVNIPNQQPQPENVPEEDTSTTSTTTP